MDIRIDASSAQIVANAFATSPEIATSELLSAMQDIDLHLQREVAERTPVGVGGGAGLRGSIDSEEQLLSDGVIGAVFSNLAHARPVELGTRPHFPPLQPIRDWVEAKLGIDAENSKSVAFAIARKISKVGTEGAFMFRDAFQEHQGSILRRLDEAIEQIKFRTSTL